MLVFWAIWFECVWAIWFEVLVLWAIWFECCVWAIWFECCVLGYLVGVLVFGLFSWSIVVWSS